MEKVRTLSIAALQNCSSPSLDIPNHLSWCRKKSPCFCFFDYADRVVIPFQRRGDYCSEKCKTAHSVHLHTIDGHGPESRPISPQADRQLFSFGDPSCAEGTRQSETRPHFCRLIYCSVRSALALLCCQPMSQCEMQLLV